METIRRKLRSLVLVLSLVVLGLVSFGSFVGGRSYQAVQAQVGAAEIIQRQQKMVEFIVKRNPQATIKEFADLPDYILEVSAQYGIDYRLVMAVIDKESQFHTDLVGGSGEIGLMQIMPSTGALIAKRLGEPFTPPRGRGAPGTLGDPKTNIRYGVQYLAWQIAEFGGVGPVALRAYNRAPEHARANWPQDRYAEDIALGYVVLASVLPEAGR